MPSWQMMEYMIRCASCLSERASGLASHVAIRGNDMYLLEKYETGNDTYLLTVLDSKLIELE